MPSAKQCSWSVRVGAGVAVLGSSLRPARMRRTATTRRLRGRRLPRVVGAGRVRRGCRRTRSSSRRSARRHEQSVGHVCARLLRAGGQGLFRLPQQPGRDLWPQVGDVEGARRPVGAEPGQGARGGERERHLRELQRGAGGSGWGDLAKAGIPTYVWAINPAQAAGHKEIFGNREVICISCVKRRMRTWPRSRARRRSPRWAMA